MAGQGHGRASGSRPDREEVRAELSAHLEDKALDFQRIFPGLTEEEAQERAAAEMGDPVEIGKELAKIHRPWLGYLWRASQGLAGGALIWLVVVAVPLAWSWLNPRETETEESLWTYEAEIPFSSQGPVQAGGYTLQVEGVLQMEEGHDVGELALTWTAFSPLVWEEPTSHLYWRAEDNLGNVYFSHADLDMAHLCGRDLPICARHNLGALRLGLDGAVPGVERAREASGCV